MTNGSKYRIVDWRLLRYSGLFWRLLDEEEEDGTREGSVSHFLGGGFASLLSLHGGRGSRAGFPPTIT
jgi:hypothetical protein